MKKAKSTLGGAFLKEDISIKKESKTITSEDAEILMNFFDMIAFKKFKSTLETFKSTIETAWLRNFIFSAWMHPLITQ